MPVCVGCALLGFADKLFRVACQGFDSGAVRLHYFIDLLIDKVNRGR
jgi:hypothetical protein